MLTDDVWAQAVTRYRTRPGFRAAIMHVFDRILVFSFFVNCLMLCRCVQVTFKSLLNLSSVLMQYIMCLDGLTVSEDMMVHYSANHVGLQLNKGFVLSTCQNRA